MRIALFSLVLVALITSAAAQEPTQRPAVLDQVYACANVTAEAERLACYDAAVGRLREAQSSGNLVAVDRVQAEEIERDAFGFTLPSLPRLFGNRETAATPVAEAQLEIARVTRRPNLPAVFTMTNGQVWTQIDTESTRNVREGGAVTVRRAALGSYMMSVEAGGHAIRVRRTQ